MKRFLVMLMAFFLTGFPLFADDWAEVKKQINRIKKSSLYIYAEVTAAEKQEAKDLAEEILYSEINEWAAKQKKLRNSPNLVVNNRKELWESVELPRGNMFRAFLFVKKSDIIPAENAEVITAMPSTIEEIKRTVDLTSQLPDAVLEIAQCRKYSELAAMITEMKQQGRICDYGRYVSLDRPEDYFLAIYNREGEVVAVLTPGERRQNVENGQPDSEKNYAGCGAIGFKLNN